MKLVSIGKREYTIDGFGPGKEYTRIILPRQAELSGGQKVQIFLAQSNGSVSLKEGDLVIRAV